METVVSTGEIGTTIIWDIASGNIIAKLEGCNTRKVCFSPCGTLLASGSRDGSIIVWDCQTWTRMQTFTGHTDYVTSVGFGSSSDKIVSTSADGTVRVWSLEPNAEALRVETGNRYNTTSANFNNCSDTIVVSVGNEVNLYDSTTGELKRSLFGHADTIYSVQFSQDGRLLVSGSGDTSVMLWDVASGRMLRQLRGHTMAVSQVCLSPDASRIVSCSWDSTARIWDVSSGMCVFTLSGHKSYLYCCCFSEDGSKVVTSGEDGTVKVWDSYAGEELRTLSDHIGPVYSVSYRPSPVGSYI